jgi:hypothetical protein
MAKLKKIYPEVKIWAIVTSIGVIYKSEQLQSSEYILSGSRFGINKEPNPRVWAKFWAGSKSRLTAVSLGWSQLGFRLRLWLRLTAQIHASDHWLNYFNLPRSHPVYIWIKYYGVQERCYSASNRALVKSNLFEVWKKDSWWWELRSILQWKRLLLRSWWAQC